MQSHGDTANTYLTSKWGVVHRPHPQSDIASRCGKINAYSVTHTARDMASFAASIGAETCAACEGFCEPADIG